jgi:PAS domain S-box-containing protein
VKTTSGFAVEIFDDSECGQLARRVNWSETALGPTENWPQSLRTALEIIMKSAFPMFISWGKERVFLYNDAYARILGKKHPNAMGKAFAEVWPEIWRDIEPLVLAVDSGQSLYLEDLKLTMNRHGFDEETYFTFSYSPVRGESNQVAGLFCAVSETTRRVLTERQLKQNQEQLKGALSSGRMGTWSINLATNRATVSEETRNIFGFEQFEDEDVYALISISMHADDREEVERVLAEAIAKKIPYQHEYKIVKPSGEIVWISSHGQAQYESEGTPLTLSGIVADITDRKNAELQLRNAEASFRNLANTIPQLAWMADNKGWIFWYNQRWYDYTGTNFEEMQGWGWEKVHDPIELKRMSVTWQKSLATGEPWEDKFPLRSQSGQWRWFLSRARPMRNQDGEIIYWFGTNTDIDEQLQFESELKQSKEVAEKANQAKTQFLANMSHEIRTPIGAIIGFTDLLKNPSLSLSERHDFMSIIERNSQNLLRLIDDILDLSKVEAGKIALEKANFNLAEFIADLASVMELRSSEKGIEFKVIFDGAIPELICTDQLRLRQILANVTGNAVKFTEKGKVELLVKYDSPFLRFTVSDTGSGIAPESTEHLFQPFAQADPSMTRKYGGTGLGLILSRRLSRVLGGDLVLISTVLNKGSTFEVTVEPTPVAASRMVSNEQMSISKLQGELPDSGRGSLAGLRILLVEDSPDNRVLIVNYLKKTGASVLMAENGLEGVKVATQNLPDVVLMDVQMAVMDGHTATRKLRSSGFSKPIIALTAHAMREERDKCFESGCTDFLTKPIQRDHLIEVLSRYLPPRS